MLHKTLEQTRSLWWKRRKTALKQRYSFLRSRCTFVIPLEKKCKLTTILIADMESSPPRQSTQSSAEGEAPWSKHLLPLFWDVADFLWLVML